MAQFDVYRNPRGGLFPLLLDIQSDLLSRLSTRVVAPLRSLKRFGARPITRLNPTAKIEGVEYVLLFQDISALPTSELVEKVASLASRRSDLIGALDLLFTGI